MTLKRAKYDPSPDCDVAVNSIENGTYAALISLNTNRFIYLFIWFFFTIFWWLA